MIQDEFIMSDLIIVGILFIISLFLGFIKYSSLANAYKNSPWQLKFIELWNDFVNFFIAGLIGYYFILVRVPLLLEGRDLNTSDFVLFIIFMLGLFGHLCVMSKNITEGIQAILKRVLGGK